jgi:hypothetical protein
MPGARRREWAGARKRHRAATAGPPPVGGQALGGRRSTACILDSGAAAAANGGTGRICGLARGAFETGRAHGLGFRGNASAFGGGCRNTVSAGGSSRANPLVRSLRRLAGRPIAPAFCLSGAAPCRENEVPCCGVGAQSSADGAKSSGDGAPSSDGRAQNSARRAKSSGRRATSSVDGAKSSGDGAPSSDDRAQNSACRAKSAAHRAPSFARRVNSSERRAPSSVDGAKSSGDGAWGLAGGVSGGVFEARSLVGHIPGMAGGVGRVSHVARGVAGGVQRRSVGPPDAGRAVSCVAGGARRTDGGSPRIGVEVGRDGERGWSSSGSNRPSADAAPNRSGSAALPCGRVALPPVRLLGILSPVSFPPIPPLPASTLPLRCPAVNPATPVSPATAKAQPGRALAPKFTSQRSTQLIVRGIFLILKPSTGLR